MGSEGITKVITINPEGDMNVCTTSIQCCGDASLKATKGKPHSGARAKAMGSPKSLGFILWEPLMSLPNFMAINPIVVEIFQSGPKWWTNQ